MTGCALYINIADGVEVGGVTDKIVQPALFLSFSPFAFLYFGVFFGDDETQHDTDGVF